MTPELAKSLLRIATGIQNCANSALPPSEVTASPAQPILPHSLYRKTRGYIEKVAIQVNRSYKETCYDSCAVMIRRLVETLIIEAFEHQKVAHKIKDPKGEYVTLRDLVEAALSEQTWHLGRNAKAALKRLKTIGDQSAHSRRYNARREYIDENIIDLRTVFEEFLYVAGIRD